MTSHPNWPLLVVVPALLCCRADGQDPAADFRTKVTPLLEAHCFSCHGPDVQKAGLRLDDLPAKLGDERNAAVWVNVHDKLAAGEMPPKGKKRPAPDALRAATASLDRALHDTSLDRQKKKGRVVVRRLNGTEYENTIRDLLDTNVALKEMLPEDNSVAGFDNVSSALDVSATHQLLYQEAAERAVLSVIPPHPPIPFTDRRTGKEMSEKGGGNFKQTLTKSCCLKGDSLVVYSKLPRYGLCSTAAVPASGRYKVKMSIAAVGAANKAVPAAFLTVDGGREDPVVREFRDIPPGKPVVVETEIDLKRRQAFVVNLLSDVGHSRLQEAHRRIRRGRVFLVESLSRSKARSIRSRRRAYDNAVRRCAAQGAIRREGGKRRLPPADHQADNRQPEAQWFADPLVPASVQPEGGCRAPDPQPFLPRAFRRPVRRGRWQQHFIGQVLMRNLTRHYTFL